jgi:hypothetical protein
VKYGPDGLPGPQGRGVRCDPTAPGLTSTLSFETGGMTMKKAAFILYTIICIAIGSILFQDNSDAGGNYSSQYWSAYELGTPPGNLYRACMGVTFKGGVVKEDVVIDWKSNENFVIYIEK